MKLKIGMININDHRIVNILEETQECFLCQGELIDNIPVDNIDVLLVDANDNLWKRNVIIAKEKKKWLKIVMICCETNSEILVDGYELGVDLIIDHRTNSLDVLKEILLINDNVNYINKSRYKFNYYAQEVMRDDQVLHLPSSSFILLDALVREANKVLTKDELAKLIMLKLEDDSYHMVDNYIKTIKALTNDENIKLIRGRGYMYYID